MKTVNIINFVRGIDEIRGNEVIYNSFFKEVDLIQRYNFPATWLLQYDALVTGPYVESLKKHHAPGIEYGIWLEMDRYLAEDAGVEWKGRMIWDHYANCAFTLGYTHEERIKLCDTFVEKFTQVFGSKPKVMGSWCFDAFTLNYLYEKHGITGACNCKDQQGTDGYTLRGGYFANAYYPSINNSYMPAQSVEKQIPVPVFRMLGSDPLHQYDCAFEDEFQLVISMEPIYKHAGGDPEWVDWYLRETYTRPSLAMAYTQVGQENSFPAGEIFPGLEMQFEKIREMQEAGLLVVENLGTSAAKFREQFSVTPATAVTTLTDWRQPASAGVWYLCCNYRINFFQTPDGKLQIRSWNLFDENFPERNLVEPLTDKNCVLETLPLWDSYAWDKAFFGLHDSGGHIEKVEEDRDTETLKIYWQSAAGDCCITCTPQTVRMDFSGEAAVLDMELAAAMDAEITAAAEQEIFMRYRNWDYKIELSAGKIIQNEHNLKFVAENGILEFRTGKLS